MSLLALRSKIKKSKRTRVGRGSGSGHGNMAGRGNNGQKKRAGGTLRPGFEGGQTPFSRLMPKLKGFKNPNKIEFLPVNTGSLNIFDDNSKVTVDDLLARNLISKKNKPVKLLGGKGELEKTLEITVHKASASAIKAVEAKKGHVHLLQPPKQEEKKEEEKIEESK